MAWEDPDPNVVRRRRLIIGAALAIIVPPAVYVGWNYHVVRLRRELIADIDKNGVCYMFKSEMPLEDGPVNLNTHESQVLFAFFDADTRQNLDPRGPIKKVQNATIDIPAIRRFFGDERVSFIL